MKMNDATLFMVPGAGVMPPSEPVNSPMEALFERNLLQHRRLFAGLEALRADICEAAVLLADTLHRGGRLLFCGNGGSAASSLHLAAEFNGRLARARSPLPALALCADGVALTGIANDRGYDEVYARQVEVHGRTGDCLVALSTSGESANVLRALQAAQERGVVAIALLGRAGGRARALADLALVVPHYDSACIREAHLFIGHTWCTQVESALGPQA